MPVQQCTAILVPRMSVSHTARVFRAGGQLSALVFNYIIIFWSLYLAKDVYINFSEITQTPSFMCCSSVYFRSVFQTGDHTEEMIIVLC